MEPLFTNKCTYTKEVYRESLLNYNKRKRTISIIIFCLLILIIVMQIILYSSTFEISLALLVIVPSIIAYLVIPLILAGLSYKRSVEIYHEEIVATSEFYDDHFVSTLHPSNATMTVQYDQLKRLVSTKQLYLLGIRYHVFYIINKNGFDKINMLEFEKFLREKAPKAKFQL